MCQAFPALLVVGASVVLGILLTACSGATPTAVSSQPAALASKVAVTAGKSEL